MGGAMRVVRVTAVVLAILGGVYAVLGYATVVRDKGGSDVALGSVWLLITGVLAIVIVGLAVLASPRNAQNDARACPSCGRPADEDWNLCPACGVPLPPPIYEVAPRPVGDEQAEGEWPAEDYESKAGLLGTVLFWLGMLVLDVLFVLLALWIFVPALALAQRIFLFWSLAGIGIGCILAGSSLAPRSTIRL
jgi:hypothetical protein